MKGKFTNLEVFDNGIVVLSFNYKTKFFKIKETAKRAIMEDLKAAFRGLKEITIIQNDEKEIDILMTLEKPNDDETLKLELDVQAKLLANLIKHKI